MLWGRLKDRSSITPLLSLLPQQKAHKKQRDKAIKQEGIFLPSRTEDEIPFRYRSSYLYRYCMQIEQNANSLALLRYYIIKHSRPMMDRIDSNGIVIFSELYGNIKKREFFSIIAKIYNKILKVRRLKYIYWIRYCKLILRSN